MTAKLNPVNVRTYNMAEQTKHDYICEGCEKVSKDLECTVYAQVPITSGIDAARSTVRL
jgi:hypothetical protein